MQIQATYPVAQVYQYNSPDANSSEPHFSLSMKGNKEHTRGVDALRAREPLSNGLPRFGYSAKDILVATLRRRVLGLSSGLYLAWRITRRDIA